MRDKDPGLSYPGDRPLEEVWRDSVRHSTVKELREYIANVEKELEDPDWNVENRRQAEQQVKVAKEGLANRTKKKTASS